MPARPAGGADLDGLRARANHRDQLTDPQRRTGVPVGLLPIVVSVSGLQHPRDHGVHPLSVDLQLHLACPPDGWLAGHGDPPTQETTTHLLPGGPRASPELVRY
ncbi:MAG: hypothetical protein ACRDR6_28835 [Pseudonocardiaceae bacterium]